jgi:hypothetical protein
MQINNINNISTAPAKSKQANSPVCKQFIEKHVAPSKPKGLVMCYLQTRYKEKFLQVIFLNPQDSYMIRVPNQFGDLRVKVKVGNTQDLEMLDNLKKEISESKQPSKV